MSFNVDAIKNFISECEIVFFDLDGTLVDSEPLYFRFWKEACEFYGYIMSDEQALNMRSRYKESSIEFLKEISNGKLDYYKVKAKRIELMDKYLLTHPLTLKEYALDILNKLKNENKKIYIVTANTVDKANEIISSLGFINLISGIISAKDVKRGKPFPDVYLKACEIVNIKPSDIIVFEDSPNGLISSSKAGCFTVMIEDMSKYNSDMKYVDGAITSYKEIL